jgi:predicted O-linked N-acetylglucosamine transferase (SPINDLY family)
MARGSVKAISNLQTLVQAAVNANRERRFADAVEALEHALAEAPARVDLREALVRNLIELGDSERAERAGLALVERAPRDANAHNMLGVIVKQRGQMERAIELFRKAAALDRKLHSPWVNLGNAARTQGRIDEAVEAFRQAVKLKPRDADLIRLLGISLGEAGKGEEALAQLNRAVMIDARNFNAFHDRAVTHFRLGKFDEAVRDITRALQIKPDELLLQRTRGMIMRRVGRLAEARGAYEAILAKQPDDVRTLEAYGNLCGNSLGDYPSANAALRKALALRPGDIRIAARLCDSLMDSRYDDEGKFIDEAQAIAAPLVDAQTPPVECADDLGAVFRRTADYARLDKLGEFAALTRYWAESGNAGALQNQLSRAESDEHRRILVECHRIWGAQVSARAPHDQRAPAALRPLAGRKIRIGLMSSDLRNHPVSYFALPIFEHYDRSRVELYCYSFDPRPADKVRDFIAARVDAFRLMPDSDLRETAQAIRRDGIDILIELGGTTRYNRLEVMAYRPAPVGVSWLGYPHSSGLAEIDYILTDPYLEPEDQSLLIERPFRMPQSWVCLGRLGFHDQPIDPVIPEDRDNILVFGTMNNPYKFTEGLIATWAQILARVPGSRFLLVRPEAGAEAFRSNMRATFAKHGVAGERIDFVPGRGNHMQHYNKIDIALDSTPHTGGTTTCETIWMGVPVVSQVGPAFFERLSYSNLSNAGLGDLCAKTRAEYVEIAVKLAADKDRRRALRQGLRDHLRGSPLGQTKAWVDGFIARAIEAVEAKAGA